MITKNRNHEKTLRNVILGLIGLLTVSAQAQSFLIEGLVASYPFNGNGSDASGNGHDGVFLNTAAGSNRFGEPGQAMQFTSNSSFEVPGSFIPSGHDPMTVSLWMRIEAPTLPPGGFSKFPLISTTLDSSTTWNFHLIFQGNGVDFSPVVERFDTTGYLGPYARWSLFPDYPTALNWHQVTLSFRSDTETALFLDGQPVAWQQAPTPLLTDRNGGTFAIGSAPLGNRGFSGSLDDVRIYNRALSDQEASDLYHQTAVPEPEEYASVTGLALGVFALVQRRKQARKV